MRRMCQMLQMLQMRQSFGGIRVLRFFSLLAISENVGSNGPPCCMPTGLIPAEYPKPWTNKAAVTLLGQWLQRIAQAAIYFSELSEAFQPKSRVS